MRYNKTLKYLTSLPVDREGATWARPNFLVLVSSTGNRYEHRNNNGADDRTSHLAAKRLLWFVLN